MKLKRILLVVCALFAGVMFWGYAHSESYCFFYPAIDTQYAPGFSEQAFAQIKVGMTEAEVRQKLGAPLTIGQNAGSDLSHFYYTLDGKCTWGGKA
jgi:outer membrane protein assembly factor BamE (lipoprotein component of BamABCDE complex)